jgi:hypothetical protein
MAVLKAATVNKFSVQRFNLFIHMQVLLVWVGQWASPGDVAAQDDPFVGKFTPAANGALPVAARPDFFPVDAFVAAVNKQDLQVSLPFKSCLAGGVSHSESLTTWRHVTG